jgi:hypothetical protein
VPAIEEPELPINSTALDALVAQTTTRLPVSTSGDSTGRAWHRRSWLSSP